MDLAWVIYKARGHKVGIAVYQQSAPGVDCFLESADGLFRGRALTGAPLVKWSGVRYDDIETEFYNPDGTLDGLM